MMTEEELREALNKAIRDDNEIQQNLRNTNAQIQRLQLIARQCEVDLISCRSIISAYKEVLGEKEEEPGKAPEPPPPESGAELEEEPPLETETEDPDPESATEENPE